MSYAVLDLGSNSVRLLIGNVIDGRCAPKLYERAVTRISVGLSATGLLGEGPMRRTLEVLRGFRRITEAEGATVSDAVGTSALREAGNSAAFLERVRAETGFEVRVISGEEEASLTALGVVASLGPMPSAMIVDIGGGSTEMAIVRGHQLVASISEPVGAVGLIERHIKSDPPARAELESLRAECDAAALRFRGALGAPEPGMRLVGAAGTMSTIAAMDLGLVRYERDRVHGHVVTIGRLREIYRLITAIPLHERLLIKGLEPDRTDLIMAGLTLTICLMETFGYRDLMISDAGLLEGLLTNMSLGGGISV